jgi:hypothetical protein
MTTTDSQNKIAANYYLPKRIVHLVKALAASASEDAGRFVSSANIVEASVRDYTREQIARAEREGRLDVAMALRATLGQ